MRHHEIKARRLMRASCGTDALRREAVEIHRTTFLAKAPSCLRSCGLRYIMRQVEVESGSLVCAACRALAFGGKGIKKQGLAF
jgi:hypothetical protein